MELFKKEEISHPDIQALRASRTWILLAGAALVILGTLGILAPVVATFANVLFLGGLLLAGGIVQIAQAFSAYLWRGFLFHLLFGILNGVVGWIMISNPEASALSLTLLLASIFIVSGIFKITASLIGDFYHWVWLLISGVITLLLGIMIFKQWPVSGLWVIGLFVGIDLLFAGWTLIMLGFSLKKPIHH